MSDGILGAGRDDEIAEGRLVGYGGNFSTGSGFYAARIASSIRSTAAFMPISIAVAMM